MNRMLGVFGFVFLLAAPAAAWADTSSVRFGAAVGPSTEGISGHLWGEGMYYATPNFGFGLHGAYGVHERIFAQTIEYAVFGPAVTLRTRLFGDAEFWGEASASAGIGVGSASVTYHRLCLFDESCGSTRPGTQDVVLSAYSQGAATLHVGWFAIGATLGTDVLTEGGLGMNVGLTIGVN